MISPLISVIITAYNYGHTLRQALVSVLAQDYPHFEIILLDNASTDTTQSIIDSFSYDGRIRAFRNNENIGMIPNHNLGIAHARGAFTIFLAADNVMMPGALSRAYRVFSDHPHVEIVYSGIYLMSPNGRITHQREHEFPAAYIHKRDELPHLLGYGCDMQIESMLVRHDIWKKYGILNEAFVAADYEILLRWAANNVHFAYITEPATAFRIHHEQQSSVKNYVTNGKQLDEFVAFLEQYTSLEYYERLGSFRHAIVRNLHEKETSALRYLTSLNPDTSKKIETLNQFYAREHPKPRSQQALMSVVVLATSSLYAIEHSIRSLLAQTYQRWEALVISQPGASLDAFCQHIDPSGRTRSVTLSRALSESHALNTGLLLATGDSVTFLRAGSAFPSDHVAKLSHQFSDATTMVTVAKSKLILTSVDLDQYLAHDAFPQSPSADDLLVAPSLPLEVIATRREAIDQLQGFHLEYPVYPSWEMSLRFIRKFGASYLDSTVSLNTIVGESDLLLNASEWLASADKLYRNNPTTNKTVLERRESHRASLKTLLDGLETQSHGPSQRLHAYQKISGLKTLQEYQLSLLVRSLA